MGTGPAATPGAPALQAAVERSERPRLPGARPGECSCRLSVGTAPWSPDRSGPRRAAALPARAAAMATIAAGREVEGAALCSFLQPVRERARRPATR